MAKNNKPTHVVTGKDCRLSYANIWEPKAMSEGQDPKYSVSILIPKSDKETLAAVSKGIDAAIDAGIGKFGGKRPNKKNIRIPLRDGDTEKPDDENYAGHYFINANSYVAPQIRDARVRPILDRSEVYSGCYARVALDFIAFNTNGNKGVRASLCSIQKIRDGEPLGGRVKPEDDFEVVEDDQEDTDLDFLDTDDLPF